MHRGVRNTTYGRFGCLGRVTRHRKRALPRKEPLRVLRQLPRQLVECQRNNGARKVTKRAWIGIPLNVHLNEGRGLSRCCLSGPPQREGPMAAHDGHVLGDPECHQALNEPDVRRCVQNGECVFPGRYTLAVQPGAVDIAPAQHPEELLGQRQHARRQGRFQIGACVVLRLCRGHPPISMVRATLGCSPSARSTAGDTRPDIPLVVIVFQVIRASLPQRARHEGKKALQ